MSVASLSSTREESMSQNGALPIKRIPVTMNTSAIQMTKLQGSLKKSCGYLHKIRIKIRILKTQKSITSWSNYKSIHPRNNNFEDKWLTGKKELKVHKNVDKNKIGMYRFYLRLKGNTNMSLIGVLRTKFSKGQSCVNTPGLYGFLQLVFNLLPTCPSPWRWLFQADPKNSQLFIKTESGPVHNQNFTMITTNTLHTKSQIWKTGINNSEAANNFVHRVIIMNIIIIIKRLPWEQPGDIHNGTVNCSHT